MKKLLSLPPNLVECFHDVAGVCREEYFCTSDPVGARLGSGGGTNWLMEACHQDEAPEKTFEEWLSREKRILLHAGGQSRRLPGYAPSGKVLTPIPVFRWARGQRIGQNLLQLQLPLYQRIMNAAPAGLRTLIASGDVYIRAGKLQQIPDADVVCYGLWVDPSLAKNHGVFLSKRETPEVLDFVLQKPSVEKLGELMHTHLFLMDIGIWLLSDKAVNLLMRKSTGKGGEILNYDLYSDFGQALGENPTTTDAEISQLKVAVLPLQDGEFYHYGTSREMISSTMAIQNLVYDQRAIMHLGVKAHPSIFTQNCHHDIKFTPTNQNTWIENSRVPSTWTLTHENIITGVPQNDWTVNLAPGVCVDVVPLGENQWVLRPYGFNDAMRGDLRDASTEYLGQPVGEWLSKRGISADEVEGNTDLQNSRIFPVCNTIEEMGRLLQWMIAESPTDMTDVWRACERLSANEISDKANLRRLQKQRLEFRKANLTALANNHRCSIFYQTNLDDLAHEFHNLQVPVPEPLPESEPLLKRINDHMFRSRLLELNGQDGSEAGAKAFSLLGEGLTEDVLARKQMPQLDVYSDQIVWGRSPVRIDLAGGWTDTPPYCLTSGGSVVNLAIELNGQPPLQAYVKPSADYHVVLRSIDLGAIEILTTWDELADFAKVGSPFSIPKAALALAGFLPQFCQKKYKSLQEQLKDFGCGIEVTLLSAIPAGSGLGTSSILAATVLGAVSDFCGLAWSKNEICNRTLVLEQLLTTGGGWQDQYGGVLHGVKLLTTQDGFEQTPEISWLSDNLFTDSQYQACHLLYYTGITRTAKKILAEIVRGMFLYDTERLQLLGEMKEHAQDVAQAIMRGNYTQLGTLVGKTWYQNQLLDSGTNPPEVQAIIGKVQDLCLGLKLPGAGGGGFLYMVAKDPAAALRIREILTKERPNDRARFVQMGISRTGLQISRS
ncbi:MAG: bifunctional fucokinase/L-fucose-1-P-guanylyltransferase [Bacteroidaceae bacterium]|nr:bifunctional fucokinase/L-fucose-1-P-guanylyltransferase [Bacteroidaceae bacterium]